MALNPFFRISTKEKMFFARHMAMMSRAQMQTIDILKALKLQTRSRSFKTVIAHLITELKNGEYLHTGLKKYEKLFGTFFINIVRIGEISGSLSENLEYLADSLEKEHELKSKARGALIYPIIILFATLGIASAMMFFIFPKILPVFENMKITLPLITRIFIGVSNFILHNGVYLGLGIVACAFIISLLIRVKSIRFAWQRFILAIPIFGTMVQNYNLVLISRTMSMLLKGGTRIVEALKITSDTLENIVYGASLVRVAKAVDAGDQMTKLLSRYPSLYPELFTQMIGVGERTGNLSETQTYMANFYEKELDNSSKSVTSVIEPLLLLLMGGVVAFVALAIILPIYEVSQNINH